MNIWPIGRIGVFLLSALLVLALVTPVLASEKIDISGAVEKIFVDNDGTLEATVVGGHRILFDEDTEVDGVLKIGVEADIEAEELGDGTLLALKVETDLDEIKGIVGLVAIGFTGGQKLLQAGGAQVFVDDETEVRGGLPVVGAEVRIEVEFRDGKQFAAKIEVLSMPTEPVGEPGDDAF